VAEFFFTNGIPSFAGPLVGSESFPFDDSAGVSRSVSAQLLAAFVSQQLLPAAQYSADSAAASFTATPGETVGSELVVLDLTGALGAPANVTTPSSGMLWGAIANPTGGQTYVLRLLNNSSGAFAWTLVGGSGVTVVGTASVLQNQWREWLVTLVNSGAVTMQNVGAGDV
jgi:hypothetical protein